MLCHRQYILAVTLGWALLPIRPDHLQRHPPLRHLRGYLPLGSLQDAAPGRRGRVLCAKRQHRDAADPLPQPRRQRGHPRVPGHRQPTDIGTDINFPQTPHPACDGCADQTMAQAKAAVQATPDFKFVIVGHSLGGGLANMAYIDMQRAGMKVDLVVSYGELAVGNQQYADHVDKIAGASDDNVGMFWRVTHANELHPTPHRVLGPRRAGRGVGEPDDDVPVLWADVRGVQHTGQGGIGINTAHVFYPGLNVLSCGIPPRDESSVREGV
ncbi:uncharacterized protein PG986_002196 [Apiospora aurea]|uniref:Fungal lipase-type domain-containing protein n=1 Tax=Apiospora aurea TaxID=335848 RepID=A0ABR1QZ65_9PEZI